ncbi:hypothetical protein MNBD_ALPHA04-1691 [hydrothermal vent metagenome]|uniref:Uncharacterized protein n=1 Tax=hydrothermal vent metagenome TaxID=652676 RepID=A0A3B0SHQ5_9ZZZZ
MMEKLLKKGTELAENRRDKSRQEIKSALEQILPDQISAEEIPGGIAVQSPDLGDELIVNSSLRDVAFLMRGVR